MLSSEHRRFLVVDQAVVPGIFNLVLNAGIAWLLFRSVSMIPLWGATSDEASAGVDLLATAFLLPFFSCLIVSRLVVGQVRSGKLAPLPPERIPVSGWSHRSIFVRGLFLGVCGIVLAAAPLVAALSIADSASFGTNAFVGFKAGWTALLAAVISPVIAWWALAHASRSHDSSVA